jgi:hypothetical protein
LDKIIVIDFDQADFYYFLEKVDRHHDNHEILDHGCQTIPKRETVLIVGHFSPSSLNFPPFVPEGGRGFPAFACLPAGRQAKF